MNNDNWHFPLRQSFPTDVTHPVPSQLTGPNTDRRQVQPRVPTQWPGSEPRQQPQREEPQKRPDSESD